MRRGALALGALALLSCQQKGRAHADRISTKSQLIGGPKALGQIGDYLLENDKIRVVIHGPGANRGSTVFGGSLIDADLRRPGAGNDQLGEVFPAYLFEAVDPTKFEIVNDGRDGGAAIVAVEGVGGDLLQMVAVLNTGLLFPPGLVFREEYKLEPGKRWVEITSSITNASGVAHPLPYLDPPDLATLGLDIPGLDTLQLSVPLGHLALFGAENELFAEGPAGFDVRFAIEREYPQASGFPAFPGLVTNMLATRGNGVSYALVAPSSPDNYPSRYSALYPNQQVTDHGLLIPYLYSSVTGVFHAEPPPVLLPGQTFEFTLYFVVGRGDVGSVLDAVHEIRGTETGVLAGTLLDEGTGEAIEHASVVVQDAGARFVSQYDTDARGRFRGTLAPGTYTYRIVTHTRETTAARTVSIAAGETTSVRELLPSPGTLMVQVFDEQGRRIPSKISLVANFSTADLGRDPRTFLYDLAVGEKQRSTAFDPQRTEFIERTAHSPDGRFEVRVRPGSYDLVVSRGLEYDVHTEPVLLAAGSSVEKTVTLRKSVGTDGWIGADLHLHAQPSLDSEMAIPDRVASIAAEGVEFAASTDHNFVTDYLPAIAELRLEPWLTSTVGLELTTFEMGHFNAFPLRVDEGSVRGGEFDWAGEPPQSLFDQLRGLGKYGPGETIVEVNHPRDNVLGYFSQFNLQPDTGLSEPREGLRGVLAPFGPEFAPEAFSLDFDALEVLNGKRLDITHTYRAPDPLPPPPIPSPAPAPGEIVRDQYGKPAFPGVMEDWHGLLNLGYRFTGVGNSDSHKALTQEPGYPRTYFYVGEGNDEAGRYDELDFVASIRSRRAIATNGPFVELTANGAPIGSEILDGDGTVDLAVRVRSANWIPFERVRVWSNGEVIHDLTVPPAEQHSFARNLTLALTTADRWALVEVEGSANLFPILAPQEFEPLSAQTVINALGSALDLSGLDPYGNLRPRRTFQATPIAVTNPIWIDRDGNGFTPPVVAPVAKPAAKQKRDLRREFEALR